MKCDGVQRGCLVVQASLRLHTYCNTGRRNNEEPDQYFTVNDGNIPINPLLGSLGREAAWSTRYVYR